MQIEIQNLKHVYSPGMPYETLALSGINVTVRNGEFAALIGHTGSGKTTLVQHMAGLLKPTEGAVLADGVNINEKNPEARAARQHIGIVFQYPEYQLFEETVIKDVCFGPSNQGLDEAECLKRAEQALRLVGIDPNEKGQASPFGLSGGQKRRVAIAGVLAMNPGFLILDEPTAGLDPEGHREILEMIDRIRLQRGITIVLVSHNMDDVAKLADHVIVMDRGSVLAEGSPGEVFAKAEILRGAGLELPSAAGFLEDLREGGFNVDSVDYDFESAADAAAAAIKAGKQSR